MSRLDDDMILPPGYLGIRRLGGGGRATAWLAAHEHRGHRVVIKMFEDRISGTEQQERFLAECRAIGRLSGHEAIVTVHDAGTTEDGHPYLVMDHMPGGSLQDQLDDEGPLTWEDTVRTGIRVANALGAAHDVDIVHQNVKPANLLVAEDDTVRLGDFGLARLAEVDRARAGAVVGTLAYAPPEVLAGRRAEPRSDLWSLGVTLYALLSGRSPYAGHDGESTTAAVARILAGTEPRPLPAPVPASVVAVVGNLLHLDPKDRPIDAAAVSARLEACLVPDDRSMTAGSPRLPTRPRAPAEAAPGAGTSPDGRTRMVGPPAPMSVGGTSVAETVVTAAHDAPDDPRVVPEPAAGDDPTVSDSPTPSATPTVSEGGDPGVESGDHGASDDFGAPLAIPFGRYRDPLADAVGEEAPTDAAPGTPLVWPDRTHEGPPLVDGAPPGPPRSAGPSPGESSPARARAPFPDRAPSFVRSVRHRPALLVAGVLAVLALVVVAAVALTSRGGEGGADSGGRGGAGGGGAATTTVAAATGPTPGTGDLTTLYGTPTDAPAVPTAAPELIVDGAIDCGGEGCAMALLGSRIVAANADGQIIAIDTPSGTTAWVNELGPRDVKPAVFAQGSLVVVAAPGAEGRRYQALDPRSGALIWERTFAGSGGSLLVDQVPTADSLLVEQIAGNGGIGSVSLLARGNGKTRWSMAGRTVANDAERVYMADEDEVFAVERSDGEVTWRSPIAIGVRSQVNIYARGALAGDTLVVSSGDVVLGLDTGDGRPSWRQGLARGSAPTADTGTVTPLRASPDAPVPDVVVITGPSGDTGLNVADGSPRWYEERPNLLGSDRTRSTWVAVPGQFTVGTDDGSVTVYSAVDGSEKGTTSVGAVGGYDAYADAVLAWTTDGVVAVARDTAVRLWAVEDVTATDVVPSAEGFVVAGPDGISLYRS